MAATPKLELDSTEENRGNREIAIAPAPFSSSPLFPAFARELSCVIYFPRHELTQDVFVAALKYQQRQRTETNRWRINFNRYEYQFDLRQRRRRSKQRVSSLLALFAPVQTNPVSDYQYAEVNIEW
jgi:hypothetical protein